MILLTKEFSMEIAHALDHYDGKCKNIHGHTYQLFVTIEGEPLNTKKHPKSGMVMDFVEFKKIIECLIVNKYDHSLILNKASSYLKGLNTTDTIIHVLDVQPTCENLTLHFVKILSDYFSAHLPSVKLHSIRLHETKTSYCEYFW